MYFTGAQILETNNAALPGIKRTTERERKRGNRCGVLEARRSGKKERKKTKRAGR